MRYVISIVIGVATFYVVGFSLDTFAGMGDNSAIIIGFIAVLWTVPNLLSEFDFFNRFVERGKVPKKKRRAKK